MSLPGPAFYDDPAVFATYAAHRGRPDNPNDAMEKPALLDLLGDLTGRRLLDLGCGDAALGRAALEQGAATYLGVEGSHRMVALAEQTLAGTAGRVLHADLDMWAAPTAAYDLVVSRLALHYLASLSAAFHTAYQALVPGGRLVFSVEHPVITSCDRAWRGEGRRQDWIVDDYFTTGRRETPWLGGQVVKYHHTIEDYCLGLQQAGFTLTALREARPRPQNFVSAENYQRRLRIPLFLLLAARKS